jgi:hypothetical protein
VAPPLEGFQENMRIKIIGDNNCARATRHFLRLAGFAVTEFLPVEAITQAPHAGYAITIEVATGSSSGNNPDHSRECLETDSSRSRETHPAWLPETAALRQPADTHGEESIDLKKVLMDDSLLAPRGGAAAEGAEQRGRIHFDSVESELERAVLRHVTQLSEMPVSVDRPGGRIRSERELRIVVPLESDGDGRERMDEAAAVAVEFGILRGLLDLMSPGAMKVNAGKAGANAAGKSETSGARKKKWWTFGVCLLAAMLPQARGAEAAPQPAAKLQAVQASGRALASAAGIGNRAGYAHLAAALPAPAQAQFATGQLGDPCQGQSKQFVSINQTGNTQLVAGTASKKIYVCSIHVVVAAATSVAVVEGTGSVCATGTAGVSGLGGATAATGWTFAANGGIAYGNGGATVGAEATAADNLCLFNSGSGQVSGGISYVVQ